MNAITQRIVHSLARKNLNIDHIAPTLGRKTKNYNFHLSTTFTISSNGSELLTATTLNATAPSFTPTLPLSPECSPLSDSNPLIAALHRLRKCGFSEKECNRLKRYLIEWYSSSTLEQVLTNWERYGDQDKIHQNNKLIPLSFISYNVQELATRGVEVLDLIHQVDAYFVICTEVGEKYSSLQLPDFNMFHEEGTNKNGGVVIAIGKHLKACKVDAEILNTLMVDIIGLSEPLRVIGIYTGLAVKREILTN